VAVILTSSLSRTAALPVVTLFVQLFLLVEFTVHVSSVALVVLSMTSTTAVSLPLTVALVFAARFDTVAPLAGIGSESSLLAEYPLVATGHPPVPGTARPVKFRHLPVRTALVLT
jgi:hypothetical protein